MSTDTLPPDAVAREIRAQIGAWHLARVGARDLAFEPSALHLTLTDSSRRALRVVIRLDPADTYTVRWTPCSPRSRTYPLEVAGLYSDQLALLIADIADRSTDGWDLAVIIPVSQ